MPKKTYIAPALTVVTFHSERGYAVSIPSTLYIPLLFSSLGGPKGTETEAFTPHGTWTESSVFWD